MSNQVSLLREEKRRAFSFLFSLFLLSPVRRPSTQPLTPPYLPLQLRVPRSADWPPPAFQDPPSLLPLRQRSLLRLLLLLSSWRYYYTLSLLFFFNLSLFLIVWDCAVNWVGYCCVVPTNGALRCAGWCRKVFAIDLLSLLLLMKFIYLGDLSLTLGKLVII